MRGRLIHDSAWAGAKAVVEIFEPCLPTESERAEAFAQVYEVCRAMIEAFQVMSQREAMQLRPSCN